MVSNILYQKLKINIYIIQKIRCIPLQVGIASCHTADDERYVGSTPNIQNVKVTGLHGSEIGERPQAYSRLREHCHPPIRAVSV